MFAVPRSIAISFEILDAMKKTAWNRAGGRNQYQAFLEYGLDNAYSIWKHKTEMTENEIQRKGKLLYDRGAMPVPQQVAEAYVDEQIEQYQKTLATR